MPDPRPAAARAEVYRFLAQVFADPRPGGMAMLRRDWPVTGAALARLGLEAPDCAGLLELDDAGLKRAVQRVWVDVLIATAMRPDASPSVKAAIDYHLEQVRGQAQDVRGADVEKAHRASVRAMIDRYLERDYEASGEHRDLETPPGSPIGSTMEAGAASRERQQHRMDALHRWSDRSDVCTWDATW